MPLSVDEEGACRKVGREGKPVIVREAGREERRWMGLEGVGVWNAKCDKNGEDVFKIVNAIDRRCVVIVRRPFSSVCRLFKTGSSCAEIELRSDVIDHRHVVIVGRVV